MRQRLAVSLLLLLPLPAGALDYTAYGKAAASVVRIIAMDPNSNNTLSGSGVVIPDGRIVTNCHVIASSRTVVVFEGGLGTKAQRGPGDIAADLCLLHPAALITPAARITLSETLQVDDEVVAIGFGGGSHRSISVGRVRALYPYRGGQVIQTTAGFSKGASGGGLFDRHGNLVGITTFFRHSGSESAFFAIPADWIGALASSAVEVRSLSKPFWLWPEGDQPLFLQVAALESDHKWPQMKAVARRWTQEAPDQVQSWTALRRALMALDSVTQGSTNTQGPNETSNATPSLTR